MSANDKNISNNRRKLFKALSTAPVVMTLKPGAALANASAYQCLSSGQNISNWHQYTWPHINDPCGTGETCYAYQYRNYLDTSEGVAISGINCPSLHQIIIEVGGDGSEKYLDFTRNLATPYIGIDLEDPSKRVLKNAAGVVCVKRIPVRRGLFALVGHQVDGGVDFRVDGIFPEKEVAGDLQGITGTCLTSIAGGLPPNITLSKG